MMIAAFWGMGGRMRLSKRLVAITLVLAFIGAACGGDDDGDDAGADETSTTKATTTTTVALEPADPEAAKAEITTAYEAALAQGATREQKLALVAESDDLGEVMDGVIAATPPGASIQVDEIVFTAADKATVTLTVLLDGNPVIPDFKGGAVIEDGSWKLSRKAFCDLAVMASVSCPPA